MSKQHPNQDFYKIGGGGQSDGADRGNAVQLDKQRLAQSEREAKHPSTKRTVKKK